jgi:hypothetical protein
MREITNFIRTLKSRLNYIIDIDEIWEINFVMGNASCDLDSVTSSIFYTFMKNLQTGLLTFTSSTEINYNVKEEKNRIFIPIINCKESEFFWRLEISELFKQMGLNTNDFFYFDDVFDVKNQTILMMKDLKSKFLFYFYYILTISLLLIYFT